MVERHSGLMAALRRLTANTTVVVGTRLELLANEVEEEKLRLARLFLLGALAVLFFGITVLLATVFVVVLFWDSHRLLVLGLLALGFLGAGSVAMLAFRARLSQRTKLFAQTLQELQRDRERLES